MDPIVCPACGVVLGPGVPGLAPPLPAAGDADPACSVGPDAPRRLHRARVWSWVGIGGLLWLILFAGMWETAHRERPESLADLLAAYETQPPVDETGWAGLWARVERLDEADAGDARLKPLYAAWVSTPWGRDDAEARRMLGHRQFVLAPEDLASFMDLRPSALPFMVELEGARSRRWFASADQAAWDAAHEALTELRAHVESLTTDAGLRAGLTLRENLATDAIWGRYDFIAHWAAPWLICMSDGSLRATPQAPVDQATSLVQRSERMAIRRDLEHRTQEKGVLLQQLYAAWMKRFAGPLGLQPLMDPYGGRPDLPVGVRSYADGVPLLLWAFDDLESMWAYARGVSSPFVSPVGWARPLSRPGGMLTWDVASDDAGRRTEIRRTVGCGAYALHEAFFLQRHDWRPPPSPAYDFLARGLVEWWSAVKVDASRHVDFIGINVDICRAIQRMAAEREAVGATYPVFPLVDLTAFTAWHEPTERSIRLWGLPDPVGGALFEQQSWALVHFLETHDGGRYAGRLVMLLDEALKQPRRDPSLQPAFRQAMGITSDEDWTRLDAEFQTFLQGVTTLDLAPYEYVPPPRR